MYLKPYDSPEHRIAVLKFVQTIPLKDTDPGMDVVRGVEESLSNFRSVPTLLLWGMKDFVFDRHFLAEWQRQLPHAETHTWTDCGHYLLEDAGEDAIGKVEAFLKAHPLS
jgi:haloalkane dehalogenase